MKILDTKFSFVKMETELNKIPFSKRARGFLSAEELYDCNVSELSLELENVIKKNYRNFGDRTKNELRSVVHFAKNNQ